MLKQVQPLEGVDTSTACFIGPTSTGPVAHRVGTAEGSEVIGPVTSVAEFERVCGGLRALQLGGIEVPSYVAHAARAFFDNGGRRLYVARTYQPAATDGIARSGSLTDDAGAAVGARFVARTPGAAGDGRVDVREMRVPRTPAELDSAPPGTMIQVEAGATTSYLLRRDDRWHDEHGAAADLEVASGVQQLSLNVVASDASGSPQLYEELSYAPEHPRYIGRLLGASPPRPSHALENRYALELDPSVDSSSMSWPFTLRAALLGGRDRNSVTLSAGSDGLGPSAHCYVEALASLEAVEDISTVAAPGSSELSDAAAINAALLSHVERPRSGRLAVLDGPRGSSVAEIRAFRASVESKHAALYYPWIRALNSGASASDSSSPSELALPPSGFVCGILARVDAERGTHRPPANELVRGALGFDVDAGRIELDSLNEIGVNTLRFLPDRGHRIWGARLISSDPEWRYVNVRRYYNFLEASIDRGLQWVIVEPNTPALWLNVRGAIERFLREQWLGGALLGSSPTEAFFVHVDRTTMDDDDLASGRLVAVLGFSLIRPAELIMLRIVRRTADSTA